jgi:hypothetical protein
MFIWALASLGFLIWFMLLGIFIWTIGKLGLPR